MHGYSHKTAQAESAKPVKHAKTCVLYLFPLMGVVLGIIPEMYVRDENSISVPAITARFFFARFD